MKTKKDFIFVTELISDARYSSVNQGFTPEEIFAYFETKFCQRFAESNPRFDEKKFREACK